MIKHFREISDEIKQNFLDKDDLVVEIGSNDGALILNFNKNNVIGVEPCKNLAKITTEDIINYLTIYLKN